MTEEEKSIFDIDENQLDIEWISQVKNYHNFAKKLADARRDYEQSKAERDVVDAEIDRDVRTDPAKYELPKLTEGSVGKTVLLQKKYKRANENVIQAKHKVDIIEAAVHALDHKKKALENLVQLRLSDYFSEPRAPNNSHAEMDELKMQVRKKKLNKNGRKAE